MAIYTSETFDAALEAELSRLILEHYESWTTSVEGIEAIDKSVQDELAKVTPMIRTWPNAKKLIIWLSPEESAASKDIDFEQLVHESCTVYDELDQLKFIHARLQVLTKQVHALIKKRE